jgi:hypothetical protein
MITIVKNEKGVIVAKLEFSPDSIYSFSVDTLWGEKGYELKPTYKFISETHSKDFSKPSGVLLTGKKIVL